MKQAKAEKQFLDSGPYSEGKIELPILNIEYVQDMTAALYVLIVSVKYKKGKNNISRQIVFYSPFLLVLSDTLDI